MIRANMTRKIQDYAEDYVITFFLDILEDRKKWVEGGTINKKVKLNQFFTAGIHPELDSEVFGVIFAEAFEIVVNNAGSLEEEVGERSEYETTLEDFKITDYKIKEKSGRNTIMLMYRATLGIFER